MIPSLRLSVEDMAVARGGRRIFERVAFNAGPGDYVEITGPNGAGKTSLLRVLAGLLRPLEGRVAMSSNFGPISADEHGLCMHLVGHRDGLKGPLSVADHVAFWAGLYEGSDEVAVLDRVGLTRLADRLARTLSAGQARRLALSRLLIAPRPVWLLDEPAAALDIAGRAWLLGLVSDHLASGGIVVAAVHDPIGAVPDHKVVLHAMAEAS
ncbi:MAG: heme ABC exporter ATP-binding protein CcmA [Alphaproteobacteria bacterium]